MPTSSLYVQLYLFLFVYSVSVHVWVFPHASVDVYVCVYGHVFGHVYYKMISIFTSKKASETVHLETNKSGLLRM